MRYSTIIFSALVLAIGSNASASASGQFPANFHYFPKGGDDLWLRYLIGVYENLDQYAGNKADLEPLQAQYAEIKRACDIYAADTKTLMTPNYVINPGRKESVKTAACGKAVGDGLKGLLTNNQVRAVIVRNVGNNLYMNYSTLYADSRSFTSEEAQVRDKERRDRERIEEQERERQGKIRGMQEAAQAMTLPQDVEKKLGKTGAGTRQAVAVKLSRPSPLKGFKERGKGKKPE